VSTNSGESEPIVDFDVTIQRTILIRVQTEFVLTDWKYGWFFL